MTGLPTVMITVFPEETRQSGPPRALNPVGFKPGNSLGGPHQVELQRQVLRDALLRLETREEPGRIWEREYKGYEG